MSNEWNITNEEVTEPITEVSTGESKGVTDNNKIVSIADKTSGDAESGSTAMPTAGTSAAKAVQPIPDGAMTSTPVSAASAGTAPAASQAPIPAMEPAANTAPAKTNETPNSAASVFSTQAKEAGTKVKEDADDDFDFDEEERPKRRFFRSRHEEESRDKMILSRIRDEDLMEYLTLEQRRVEFLQQAKELREKRILMAFQLLISLAAIVAVTYLLKDNPTILISILYIAGIVAALTVWKNPHDKEKRRH